MNFLTVAESINKIFYSYDYNILSFLHKLAESLGNFLTPLFNFLSLITEKGILLLLIAIILMLFKKTRKVGICMFGAVCCGAIITNFILKDLIARPRPFIDETSIFNTWWKFVGSVNESEFSFPSGHATSVVAGMISIMLLCKSKKKYLCIIPIILIGMARNYLMVHYPSDVLFGIIVGLISAFIAYLITNLIYKLLEKYSDKTFCKFILKFDLKKLLFDE